MTARHIPVLLHESVESLNLKPGDTVLDGTVGGGGHSSEIARRFGQRVKIIGLDRDREALKRSQEKLRTLKVNFIARLGSFRDLDKVLRDLGIGRVQAILLDLGISTDQLESSGRGFSFLKNEPLLMTMNNAPQKGDLTAAMVVNTFDEDSLELILRGFGEEKYSKRIAKAIVEKRKTKRFERTFDLAETIKKAVPVSYQRRRIHPATRTFQALRIAVNQELVALEEGLSKGFKALSGGGRLAVISFHSLEDRIVKNFFREKTKAGRGKLVIKRPIVPSQKEIKANPRSRSAKFRIIEKL